MVWYGPYRPLTGTSPGIGSVDLDFMLAEPWAAFSWRPSGCLFATLPSFFPPPPLSISISNHFSLVDDTEWPPPASPLPPPPSLPLSLPLFPFLSFLPFRSVHSFVVLYLPFPLFSGFFWRIEPLSLDVFQEKVLRDEVPSKWANSCRYRTLVALWFLELKLSYKIVHLLAYGLSLCISC